MRRFEWPLALISTLLAGSFLFQGNLHTDDTGIVTGLILLAATAIAFLFRKAGLVLGSLIGLSIVASELWNLKAGVPRPHMGSFSDFVLLFLFVSAISVIGSVAGFGARRVLERAAHRQA